jgi:hypothetical protein
VSSKEPPAIVQGKQSKAHARQRVRSIDLINATHVDFEFLSILILQ